MAINSDIWLDGALAFAMPFFFANDSNRFTVIGLALLLEVLFIFRYFGFILVACLNAESPTMNSH